VIHFSILLASSLAAGSGASAAQPPALGEIAAEVESQRSQLGFLQAVVSSKVVGPVDPSQSARTEERLALHGGRCLWELRSWYGEAGSDPTSPPSIVYITAEDGGLIAGGDGVRSVCSADRALIGGTSIATRTSLLSLLRWAPAIGDAVDVDADDAADLSALLRSERAALRQGFELIGGRPHAVVDVRASTDVDAPLNMTLWLSADEGWLPTRQEMYGADGDVMVRIDVAETVAIAPGIWLPSRAAWTSAPIPPIDPDGTTTDIELLFDVPGWPVGLTPGNNADFTDVCFAAGPEPALFVAAAEAQTPDRTAALDAPLGDSPAAVELDRSTSFGGIVVAIGLAVFGLGLMLLPVRRRPSA
jgi:hypothetical protein